MISLLKRMLSLIRPNVLLMRYSLCLRLNFQLLLRSNLMTSGNWLQHCSRSPVSWIHYHLPLSNNVQTYCCLPLLREGCVPTCLKSTVISPLPHPACHLVHHLFKLSVRDLTYVKLIAVYHRGLFLGVSYMFCTPHQWLISYIPSLCWWHSALCVI